MKKTVEVGSLDYGVLNIVLRIFGKHWGMWRDF